MALPGSHDWQGAGVDTFVRLKRMLLLPPRIKWMLLEVPMARAEAKFQGCCRHLEKELTMGQREVVLFFPPSMKVEVKRDF